MALTPDQKSAAALLLADPKYAGTSDAAAEAIINAQRVKPGVYGSVPMPSVLIWAAYFGVAAQLQKRAADPNDALQSKAIAMLAACNGSTPALDLGNPLVMAMLGDFQKAGDVTQPAMDALTSLAPVMTTDAKEAGLPYIDHLAIAQIRGTATHTITPGRQVLIPGDQPGTGVWQYQLPDGNGGWVNAQEPA